MKRMSMCVAGLGLMLAASGASAWETPLAGVWGSKGNDTGGIIPWSPENEQNAAQIAQSNCGFYNKYAVATSIHRVPGDYIGYVCVWDPPRPVAVHRTHRRVNVKIEK
jgi:hypothetical protein